MSLARPFFLRGGADLAQLVPPEGAERGARRRGVENPGESVVMVAKIARAAIGGRSHFG